MSHVARRKKVGATWILTFSAARVLISSCALLCFEEIHVEVESSRAQTQLNYFIAENASKAHSGLEKDYQETSKQESFH